MKLWVTIKKWPLPVLCYIVGVLLLVVWMAGSLAVNRVLYATGTLAQAQLTLEDFELIDCEIQGEALVTFSGDAQLRLKDVARRVENVTLQFNYSRNPIMVNAFWTDGGSDYSLCNMAFPQENGTFYLPALGARALRIDPGTVAGNVITIGGITINTPRPVCLFFVPTAVQLLALALVPGLVACVLHIVLQVLKAGKKNTEKAGVRT